MKKAQAASAKAKENLSRESSAEKEDSRTLDDASRSTTSSTNPDYIGGLAQIARKNDQLLSDMNNQAKIDSFIAKIPPASIRINHEGQVPEESQLTMHAGFES